MENEIMKIECVVREDGKTVARVTAKSGNVQDLLPGESMAITFKTEGAGGYGGAGGNAVAGGDAWKRS